MILMTKLPSKSHLGIVWSVYSALNECVGPCISVQILPFLWPLLFRSFNVDNASLWTVSHCCILVFVKTQVSFTQAVKEASIPSILLLSKIKRLRIKKVFCVFFCLSENWKRDPWLEDKCWVLHSQDVFVPVVYLQCALDGEVNPFSFSLLSELFSHSYVTKQTWEDAKRPNMWSSAVRRDSTMKTLALLGPGDKKNKTISWQFLTILHFRELVTIFCVNSYDLIDTMLYDLLTLQWWLCLGVDFHAYFFFNLKILHFQILQIGMNGKPFDVKIYIRLFGFSHFFSWRKISWFQCCCW